MAFYGDEDDIWKCPKHPSKRRRSGICPLCLRDRLVSLCPDCANVRPCRRCAAATTSSSSSSSSSFSRFSTDGSACRVASLIDGEPAFRRSRSIAIPFLRSRFAPDEDACSARRSSRASSFWSWLKSSKRRGEGAVEMELEEAMRRTTMMVRSRSVAVVADSGAKFAPAPPPTKGRGWYFPSPIKVFRQAKISRGVFQERSPIYRG